MPQRRKCASFRTSRAVSWGELIAGAQAIIGVYQDYPAKDLTKLYDENTALDLIASARILDSASQADEIEAAERADLAVLAMVAFGMYGNSLSSSAVSQRLLGYTQEKTPSLAVVYATAAPRPWAPYWNGVKPIRPNGSILKAWATTSSTANSRVSRYFGRRCSLR